MYEKPVARWRPAWDEHYMEHEPRVSIVIPFYSNVDWLREALESVLQQRYTNHEIIVVNDGSPEDVGALLETYGDKIVYRYTQNAGPAAARNVGIALATGTYIAFLDSDDLWHTDKLARQVALMEETGAAWSHTGYETFVADTGETISTVDVARYTGYIYPIVIISSVLATPCIMVRAEVFTQHPAFRFAEHMRYGQDAYLWCNLAVDYPIATLNESLVRVRMRGKNAALRARVQLGARAQLAKYFTQHRERFLGREKLSRMPMLCYSACRFSNDALTHLESHCRLNRDSAESLARILYLPMWIYFKLYHRAYFTRKGMR